MDTPNMTGALRDPYDPRDIPFGAIAGSIDITKQPDAHFTDISMLPVLDQKLQPACVGFARSSILTWLVFKETGKIIPISPSFGYSLSKLFDGIPTIEGTYPRVLANKNIEIGALFESDFSRSVDLPKSEYMKLDLTDKLKIKALPQKIKSFGTYGSPISEAQLVQAVLDNGLVEVTLPCDGLWRKMPFKNTKTPNGSHRVFIYGYERKEDDTYFYIRNSWGESWGKKGTGHFGWKLFAGQVWDVYSFVDTPAAAVAEAKKIPLDLTHTWNTTMKQGSKGDDVLMLQYALKLEGCMEILTKTDKSFGPMTAEALKRFQKKYNLGADGVAGPATLAVLNKHYGGKTVQGGHLDRWALAIQNHEGYYAPGSRFPVGSLSWRNRNPGNIRCAGKFKAMAIGCHALNFCIFKDYDTGFEALKTLLRDAATGKSSSYKPTMTLLQFFSKYAPSSDGNSPSTYALAVAKAIGVPVETPISNLV